MSILGIGLLILISGQKKTSENGILETQVKSGHISDDYVEVWTDEETGVEYLITKKGGITVRIKPTEIPKP